MEVEQLRSMCWQVLIGGLVAALLYNVALFVYAQRRLGLILRPKGRALRPYVLGLVGGLVFSFVLGGLNGILLTNWRPTLVEISTVELVRGAGEAWLLFLPVFGLGWAAVLMVVQLAINVQPVGSKDPPKKLDPWWLMVIAVDLLVLGLAFFKPDPFQRIVSYVRDGIWVTIYVTLISFFLVLIFGLLGGLGRLARNPIVRGAATIYVEVIRGIPVLVQLMFWYFAFPSVIKDLGKLLQIQALIDYKANPVGMAVLGLTFCYAAYMSEVYRAGIQSISKGQMEAARSLGMTYVQAMRYVILPQAVRVILPPVGNEFITLLKDSSLVSVVAVADMTRRGREFMASNFIPVQTWLMVALLYLLMTLFSTRIVNGIEQRTRLER
ncbi:MAG: amino acid ABC transporter permease [Anaerolinea sp.]|nr:amino acid ABC transporter permease [Anaerolinea sp.]